MASNISKNSGIYYYECPLCKDVLNYEFERDHYTEPMEGFFYCHKCDKKFYARHHFENDVTASELPFPLFEAHSISNGELYTLKKMQYGKEVIE